MPLRFILSSFIANKFMFILQSQISTARTCQHTISCMTCPKSTSRICSPLLNPPFAHLSSGQTMSNPKTLFVPHSVVGSCLVAPPNFRCPASIALVFWSVGLLALVFVVCWSQSWAVCNHLLLITPLADGLPTIPPVRCCPIPPLHPNCLYSLYPIPFNMRIAYVFYLLLLCGGHWATYATYPVPTFIVQRAMWHFHDLVEKFPNVLLRPMYYRGYKNTLLARYAA